MKYLTISDIKQQLRIVFDDEDALLELYGASAEDTTLAYLNRSYEDVIKTYGEVPAPVRHATLLMVTNSYEHRSVATPQQMYYVLYGYDTLLKPYMRLVDDENSN